MNDALGDRMKSRYEDRQRIMLPRRTYTVIRCDGKAFHSWTRGLATPYDYGFAAAMDEAGLRLCREAQGARLALIQSDEISVLLTDFAEPTTDAWFDGNLQKICSVSASLVTAAFNLAAAPLAKAPALFDARVFVIPDPVEAENYFIWRQKDAERNSIMALCQEHYSHAELHNKQRADQHEMLHAKGLNWNDLPATQKRGRCVIRTETGWVVDNEAPIFTEQRDYLTSRIPRQWVEPNASVGPPTVEKP